MTTRSPRSRCQSKRCRTSDAEVPGQVVAGEALRDLLDPLDVRRRPGPARTAAPWSGRRAVPPASAPWARRGASAAVAVTTAAAAAERHEEVA